MGTFRIYKWNTFLQRNRAKFTVYAKKFSGISWTVAPTAKFVEVLFSLFITSSTVPVPAPWTAHQSITGHTQSMNTLTPHSHANIYPGPFSHIKVFMYFSVQSHRNELHNDKGRMQNVVHILEAGPWTWDIVCNQSSLLGSHGLYTEFELPPSHALQVPHRSWCPISGIKAL